MGSNEGGAGDFFGTRPDYLLHFDGKLFKKKVKKYQARDFKGVSRETLHKAIYDVISVDVNGVNIFGMPGKNSLYGPGDKFFRVRWIDGANDPLDPIGIQKDSDLWMPPEARVRAGRVNAAGESLLYTAAEPTTAIREARVGDGDLFAMMMYSVRNGAACATIMPPDDLLHRPLSHADIQNSKKVNDFLMREFSRDSGVGGEHVYLASDIITKDFYDYPGTQGWLYSSVLVPGGVNVCFKGEFAKSLLRLEGVVIARAKIAGSHTEFEVLSYCDKGNGVEGVSFSPAASMPQRLSGFF